MREIHNEDLLDVVGCELDKRPDAPGVDVLEPYLLGVSRGEDALTVRFEADALETLEAFVEAERHCCAGLGWTVEGGPEAVLRIEAGPAALDAMMTVFEPQEIDNAR